MNRLDSIHHACSDTIKVAEFSTLGNIYRFVLDCHAKKEGSRPGSPNAEKGSKLDRASEKHSG